MRNKKVGAAVVLLAVICMGTLALRRKAAAQKQDNRTKAGLVLDNARQTILEGRKIFRFDTFGDEAFWAAQSCFIRPLRAANMAVLGRCEPEYRARGRSEGRCGRTPDLSSE